MDFTSCLPSPTRRLDQLVEEDFSDSEDLNKIKNSAQQRSAEWTNIENAVVMLFRRHMLGDNVLMKLHSCIKTLLGRQAGSFMFEWCQTKLFAQGMTILRASLLQSNDKEFLVSLEQIWNFFFQELLPLLQAIFLPLRKQGFTIRKAALVCFRDFVLLQCDILSVLEAVDFQVSPGIKHMFLILQSVHDTHPPNENRLQLESLVARIVIPYLGFRGYYEGDAEPVIESREPALIMQRKSIADARRVSRPLSVQPVQYERLQDLFHSAISRTSSLSDA